MTDIFENIYLRTAGPDMYDKLATHQIPWTDPSVKKALTAMKDIVGKSDEYNRYTTRLNASHQLFDVLRVGGTVSYIDTRGSFVQTTPEGLLSR